MSKLSIIVDGMLSGTGIRDAVAGGYLDPAGVGISQGLNDKIAAWLQRYENAHYYQFKDAAVNEGLDREGAEITRALRRELPGARVEYFSNAYMKALEV